MGNVFKTLRRKIGVFTLAVACVMMAGWFRSQRVADTVMLCEGEYTFEYLISVDGRLGWLQRKDTENAKIEDPLFQMTAPKWESFSPVFVGPGEPSVAPYRDSFCFYPGKRILGRRASNGSGTRVASESARSRSSESSVGPGE